MNVITEYIKKILLVFIIVLSIIVGAFFIVLNIQVDNEKQNLIIESQAEIESIRNIVEKNMLQLVKDTEIYGGLLSYYDGVDGKYLEDMAQLFIDNIQLRKDYIQMRIIDLYGNELLRVDRVNDIPIRTFTSKLQNKSERYYFKDIVDIEREDIYLSDLDLNVENGEIDIPFVPTLRSGKKLRVNGKLAGYIFLNYDSSDLIEQIHRKNNNIYKSKIIVNDRGNFIFSDKAEDNWSFVFDQNAPAMEDRFPNIWNSISSHNRGYSEGDDWVVIYERIDFDNLLVDNRLELSKKSRIMGLYLIDYISDGHIAILWDNIYKRSRNYLYIAIFIGLLFSANLANVLARLKIYRKTINENTKYDILTKLYNRDTGLNNLRDKIADVQKKNSVISLTLIKIKNIKAINRKYGYSFGDDIIKELGRVITMTIQDDDGGALRLSGNTFLVFIENIDYVKSKINMDIISEKIITEDISDKSLLELQFRIRIIEEGSDQEIVEVIGEMEEDIKKN